MRGGQGKVKKTPAEIPELKPNEVLVKITHSGLCGTDLFFTDAGCALGHEGVGVVEKVGSAVTIHNVGDRVGGGYLRSVSLPPPRGHQS
jgi:D-arabinose 1-dehydrogenase-like Zn-dependent alcohol dehydrogenase